MATYVADKRTRFVTLTLRHTDAPLADSVGRLYKCFGNLRRCKAWKRHVVGGAAFVELKHGLDRGSWHPHLHILVEGSYFPHADLKAAWLRVTQDSYIVDIRPVRSHEHLVNYVTKYVSKPLDSSVYANQSTLQEAMLALHGRRTCITFGTWRDLDLTDDTDDTTWEALGPLSVVLEHARQGDADSVAAILGLRLETTQWHTTTETRAPPQGELLTTSP